MNPTTALEQKLKELGHPLVSISPLRSTNNAVFLIQPLDVVAKLSAGDRKPAEMEVVIAHQLHDLDAPVGAPSARFPVNIYRIGDYSVSFWQYYPNEETADSLTDDTVSKALYQLHQCCAQIELHDQLPTCFDRLGEVEELLDDLGALPDLKDADQRFLSGLLRQLLGEFGQLTSDVPFQLIHGEPHSQNILCHRSELRFIDWGSACKGPIEWDLAYMTQEVLDAYPGPVSDRLVTICRELVSVAVATWCWRDSQIGDLREHGEFHLDSLKSRHG